MAPSARRAALAGAILAAALTARAVGEPAPAGAVITIYRPAEVGNPYDRRRGQFTIEGPVGGASYGGSWNDVPEEGYAVISERRKVTLKAGENELRFDDVPGGIDVGSVLVRDPGDPGLRVLEQTFADDAATINGLLGRYLGEPIVVVTDDGERKGRLASFDDGHIVLESGDANQPLLMIERGPHLRDVRFGALAGGVAARPTLGLRVHAPKAGERAHELTYETARLAWRADYTAVVAPDGKKVDLSGWLTIANRSGRRFRDASLRVVAGAPAPTTGSRDFDAYDNGMPVVVQPLGPEHRYELPGRSTLEPGATRQLELVKPTAGTSGDRLLVYDALAVFGDAWSYYPAGYPNMDQNATSYAPSAGRVDAFLEVDNVKKNGLGGDLPAGTVRVYQRDARGGVELLGKNEIDHTPSGSRLRVKLGPAGEVEASRKQVDWFLDETGRVIRETVEIHIRNKRKETVKVLVNERMFRWPVWVLESQSIPSTAAGDGRSTEFRVEVQPGKETVVVYTVKYTW